MLFPIVPTPFDSESAVGYTLRLLKTNGVLCESRVINKPTLNNIIKGKSSKDAVLDRLLPASHPPTQFKIKCWTHSRLLTPQVCIECIKQHGYFRAQWQNPFLRHCVIHDCALISACHQCDKPLAFTLKLLHGFCTSPYCGTRLTSKHCSDVLKSQERVHDAYLVAKALLNDNNPRTSYPPKEITSKLLDKAADILNNPERAQVFLDERAHRLPQGVPLNIEFNQIERIVHNLLCEWPSVATLCSMYSNNYMRANEPMTQLWFQAQTASNIIGITFQQITILHELKLIRTESISTIRTDTRIEISAIYALLNHFPYNEEYVPLFEQHDLMAFHNICLVDVLHAVKNKQLSIAYKPLSNLMHSIHVLPEEFNTFCKLQAQLIRDKTMSIANVADVTGIPKVELLRLINKGKLTPVYIQGNNSKRIRNQDILKLAKAHKKQLSLDI